MSWIFRRCRRALALLLALPLLHGAVLAGHAPCDSDRATGAAQRGSDAVVASAGSNVDAHAHHHLTAESDQVPIDLSDPASSVPASSPPPPSTPSNGCPMAMACATVAMATVVSPLGEEGAHPVSRQPLTVVDRAPELVPHAPEPPPPRA